MIPAAVSSLLAACGVVLSVEQDNRGGFVATARNADDPPSYAREAALLSLEALRSDAHREAAEYAAGVAQSPDPDKSRARAATWRVRAATLAAVCREVAKLWPEVSL